MQGMDLPTITFPGTLATYVRPLALAMYTHTVHTVRGTSRVPWGSSVPFLVRFLVLVPVPLAPRPILPPFVDIRFPRPTLSLRPVVQSLSLSFPFLH